MKKPRLILLIILLLAITGVSVYFAISQKKEGLIKEEFLTSVDLAKKITPFIFPYEASYLFDESKVFSAKGYSPHTLHAISFIFYETHRNFAKDICENSGDYHLITMEEWGIIAQAAKEENLMPRGNSDRGRSREVPEEKCQIDPKKERTCLTGTGPETWCYQGICDLNGNLAEWVDFPDIIDGVVKIDEKEFTLVPANYDMEKVLGKEGVEKLIPEGIDPQPDEKYVSGGSVIIDTSSENYNYPKTIPVKKGTVLGDFDQFRNGDGIDYGDGKYYFWVPTYDKNNNGKEEGAEDVNLEILLCDNFDGESFKDCENYRGLKLEKSQIRKEQRISSLSPLLIFPEEKLEYLYPLQSKGFVTSLRKEPELKNLAIPGSISTYLSESEEFGNDMFKIAPYGKRYAIRGGGYDDGKTSGIFSLEILIDQLNINSWNITYRCVKNYKGYKRLTEKREVYPEAELLPIETSPKLSLENFWAETLKGENDQFFYNVKTKDDKIFLTGYERNKINVSDVKPIAVYLNSDGKILWSKILNIEEKENTISGILFSTEMTKTDSFLSTGWLKKNQIKENQEDILLLSIDKEGNLLWEKTYGSKNREIAFKVSLTKNGDYIISGTVFFPSKEDSDILVVRLNKDGEVLWAKTFDYQNYFDIAYDVIELSTGEILIGGKTADSAGQEEVGVLQYFEKEKGILMKLNKSGSILWTKILAGNFGNARIFSLKETSAGDYLLGGETYPPMDIIKKGQFNGENFQKKLFLLKFDVFDNLKWGKIFGFEQINLFASLDEDREGNYIVAASEKSIIKGLGTGTFDPILFKFDSKGNLLFEKVLDLGGDDISFSVSAVKDGYIVSGQVSSSNKTKENYNGLLLKINKEGNVGSCSFLKEPKKESVFFKEFNFDSIKEVELKEENYKLEKGKPILFLLEDLSLEEEKICPIE